MEDRVWSDHVAVANSFLAEIRRGIRMKEEQEENLADASAIRAQIILNSRKLKQHLTAMQRLIHSGRMYRQTKTLMSFQCLCFSN